jgi:hypothetical protein
MKMTKMEPILRPRRPSNSLSSEQATVILPLLDSDGRPCRQRKKKRRDCECC